MAKVIKVAISIPAEQFRQVEHLRKRLTLTRSSVFVQAVQQWLKRMAGRPSPFGEGDDALGTALISESALKKDWLRPEEDDAWANL